MSREFVYTVDPEFDYTIDEKGNTFYALRKIDWGNKGDYKLDLRKYYASETGETMNKGVSLSDEGANELTRVLVETGYGDDSELANTLLENRKGVVARIMKAVNEADINYDWSTELNEEENYYDPEELIA